jgi:hypothetical protein
VISSSQRPLPHNTQQSQQTNIHATGGIQTHDLSRRAAADLRLRPRGHWNRHTYKHTHLNSSSQVSIHPSTPVILFLLFYSCPKPLISSYSFFHSTMFFSCNMFHECLHIVICEDITPLLLWAVILCTYACKHSNLLSVISGFNLSYIPYF